MFQQHYLAKDAMLSLQLAPYMASKLLPKKAVGACLGSITIGPTGVATFAPTIGGFTPNSPTTGAITLAGQIMQQEKNILMNLYWRCGDLRFLCFLPQNHPDRVKAASMFSVSGNIKLKDAITGNTGNFKALTNLLVFDLLVSTNLPSTIDTIWPVPEKNKEIWELYFSHLRSTNQDIQLKPHQFEMAHHMFKKYLFECDQNAWNFIVRIDMSNTERVGLHGARAVEKLPNPVTIFGNVTLDKLLLSSIPICDIMKLTCCSRELRLSVWLFLLERPFATFARGKIDNLLYIKY